MAIKIQGDSLQVLKPEDRSPKPDFSISRLLRNQPVLNPKGGQKKLRPNHPDMEKRKRLVMAVTRYPRLLESSQSADGRYKFHGALGSYLDIVLSSWKGGYDVVFCENETMGLKDKSGNWSGQIGMIVRGEADVGMSIMAITEERSEAVDFSTAYTMDAVTFAAHKIPQDNVFQFLRLFDITTWIAILVTLIALSSLIYLINGRKESYIATILYVSSILFGKSLFVNKNVFKCKPLIAVWFLCALVLSLSYSVILLSFITLPPPRKPLNSLFELSEYVKRGSTVYSGERTIIIPFLIESKDKRLQLMGEAMKRNRWYHNWKEILNGKPLEFGSAFFSSRKFMKLLFSHIESIHVSSDLLFVVPLGVAMSKSFCCASELNRILLRTAAAGLEEKIVKDESYKFWLEILSKSYQTKEDFHSVSIQDLFGVFILLFIGLMCSFLVLLCEIIHAYVYHDVKK
ncbi:lig_chan-Glu_bd domain-containing protein [Nephila pilipes]|uniref:Lig_chan-Glu_bd domain-containing protein n=1 Tax=Nephila pilipes TaxID=299642 RepID=A0A8X6TFF6_NEPPI|nr:lig_chan-Glu_bd domain-containing protein [Nephila pilipes]